MGIHDDLIAAGAVLMAIAAGAETLPGIMAISVITNDEGLATNKLRVTTSGVGSIIVTVEAEPF